MEYNSLNTELGKESPLFAAIMNRDEKEIEALTARGETFSEELRLALVKGCELPFSYTRAAVFAVEFAKDLNSMSSEDFIFIIPRLRRQTGAGLYYSYSVSRFVLPGESDTGSRPLHEIISEPEVFKCFLECFALRLKKTVTLTYLIEIDRLDLLRSCAEHGWFADPKMRKKALEIAEKQNKAETTAALLRFISENVDLAAEREREERRQMKELSAAPDSITLMRKTWKWTKLPGGTVMITGYFGGDTQITVPEWIGSRAVTAIGEYAFSPKAKRLLEYQKGQRNEINVIRLPDTITEIAQSAFSGCDSLSEINVPPKMSEIPKAISALHCLSTIELGGKIKEIKAGLFNEMGFLDHVILREGVTEICAFSFWRKLSPITVDIPRSVTRIDENAFAANGKQTAAVYRRSYAERFCRAHGIRCIIKTNE